MQGSRFAVMRGKKLSRVGGEQVQRLGDREDSGIYRSRGLRRVRLHRHQRPWRWLGSITVRENQKITGGRGSSRETGT